ncbi:MAG: nucleotidyltransferase domain-containing protein [Armatimonadota bacterium]
MAVQALGREELISEIEQFMRRVGVQEAIIYGSRARGDCLRTSDVDLMLISPRFEGTRPHRRLPALHEKWDPSLPFLEVLAYTPEEFERARKQLGIERIAHEEGIRITVDLDEEHEAT